MPLDVIFVEEYLRELKDSIRAGKYRIERNQRRRDNNNLFQTYVLSEEQTKDILLSLTPMDFSERVHNDHPGYEHELLYIFGKDVRLLEHFGDSEKTVSLYIKFNKLDNNYVVVISLHEQNWPLKYMFK